MTSALDRRLGRLQTIWPTPCRTCRSRPTVVGVAAGEPEPVYPKTCPQCGRRQPPVVALVGCDVDRI